MGKRNQEKTFIQPIHLNSMGIQMLNILPFMPELMIQSNMEVDLIRFRLLRQLMLTIVHCFSMLPRILLRSIQ